MKKNKSLRLASVLLMLCLITTCAVSGTFAKYTTSATATENARVAKWGIEMEAGASAFSDTYNADKVKSNGDKVVAPNSNGSNTYEVSGTPEVAYEITFDYDDLQEVYLNAGTYNYSGTNVTYESKEVTENVPATGKYYPIKYTVTLKSTNASAKYVQVDALVDEYISDASAKPFNTLKDALDAVKNTKIVYEKGSMEAGLTLTIAWSWAFDGQDDEGDTVLGDLIAGNTALQKPTGFDEGMDLANNEYNLHVAYTLKMTATQIN